MWKSPKEIILIILYFPFLVIALILGIALGTIIFPIKCIFVSMIKWIKYLERVVLGEE